MKRRHSLIPLFALSLGLSGLACAQPAPHEKAPGMTYYEYTGIVTAVDTAALTITVTKNGRTRIFAVDGGTTIRLKREYTLAQVPVTSKVFVRYKEAGGNKLAVRIQIIKLGRTVKAAR
jgi:hypothetical protein